jgi:chaperonin GroES
MRVQTNPSGHSPRWEYCIVQPDPVEEKTKGGIIIPETAQGKQVETGCTGTLLTYGPMAFKDEDGEYFDGSPDIGERVFFARYAGTLLKGEDGADYRLMKDRDIKSVVTSKK